MKIPLTTVMWDFRGNHSLRQQGETGRMELVCAVCDSNGTLSNRKNIRGRWLRIFLFLFILFSSFNGLQKTSADEEYEKFLTKLKQLGTDKRDPTYYQVAFDYLDYLEKTDLVSDAIKNSLSYEKGTLLINSAKFIRNRKQRDTVLTDGKNLLQTFITENEFHPYVPAAKNELANLLIITARQKIKEDGGKNTSLVAAARKDFVEAAQIVAATRTELSEQLKKLPARPTDPRLRKRRTEFENEFLRARLMLPSIQEELSDTYPEGSNARKTSLEAAEKEFSDVNQDYRLRTAGQLAWIYRGRCLEKLGKPKDALAVFRDIFDQPDSPEFRDLKRMTLEIAFPIWLDEKAVENGFIEAAKVTEPIIGSLSPQESRTGDWLAIRLNMARAFRQYYQYLLNKPEKTQDEKILQTKLLQAANTAARFVASSNTEVKRDAQQLLVEWGARAKVDAENVPPPKDFVEARDRASTVLAELETVKKQIRFLEEKIAAEPDKREEFLKELDEANQALVATPKKAVEYLQMAVGFSQESTPVEDINLIRYQMCFSYYTMKDYFRAALIGEFLLDRFPSINGSRESAAIAMYSYWDLYQIADPQNKKFEQQKVDKICSKIVATWPNAAESAEATRMLIAIAIESGQLDRAVELLDRIPAGSVHRASIELNTGQALWVNYLKMKKEATDGGTLPQAAKKLDDLRSKAEQLLASGVSSVTSKNINRAKAKSILSLAKIYAEQKKGAQTLELMENPEYGLIELVNSNHASTQDPRFRLDVYRTALKGFVNSIAPNSDSGTIASTMEKASAIMGKLKGVTSGMENGDKILVSLYYSFANDIKSKMDSLSSVAAKKNFSSGLSDFLVGAAGSSSDFQVVMWAASTLVKVADSFKDQGETTEASSLYKAAAGVLAQIGDKGIEVTAANKLDVIRNEGKALAGNNDYEAALKKFTQYLALRPSTLDVQIDAALALQQMGDKTGETKPLVEAIMGGGSIKDPKTGKTKKVIWGWGKLSQAIANRPQFKKQFLIARYNLAKTRLLYHKIKPSSRLMDLALKDIEVARNKYSDLGGSRMKAQFDKLIEDIKAAR